MKRIVIIGMLILLFTIYSKLTEAQPDFNRAFKKHSVVLFNDARDHRIYYYLPGNLDIGTSSDGKPDLNFTPGSGEAICICPHLGGDSCDAPATGNIDIHQAVTAARDYSEMAQGS